MNKRIKKGMGALALAALMLISTGVAFAVPAVTNTGKLSSEVIPANPIETVNAASTTAMLGLDMSATVNAEDDSLIDVVISVKDIQQELDGVEFVLDFDQTKVSGVITENGDAMNAFLTKTPMYTYVIPGVTSVEVPVSRYEQICSYDAVNGKYVCRFLDLLEYDCAKDGEIYKGLSDDGDLVITIQFRILDSVAEGTSISFTASNVKGTTREGLNSVSGTGATATCTNTPAFINPNLAIDHPSLSFESEILYNFYFTAGDLTDVVEMGMITFTTRQTDGTVDNAEKVYPGYSSVGGGMYMVQTEGVSAKNLGDAVYVKIYAKLTNGNYVYTDMVGYNAVVYAKSILKNSTNANMMRLVVAMMNYGTEAQLYFGHNVDSPMNSFLTVAQQALVQDYSSSMVNAVASVDSTKAGSLVYNGSSFTKRAPSVSFDGAFSINYYFTTANKPDGEVKLYYWTLEDYNAATKLSPGNASGSMTMTNISGNQYWGQVSGIAAKELDETVFVLGVYAYNGTTYTTGVLNYHIGKYCTTLAAKDTSEQQDLAKATAVYGYYAKEYFANL